MSEIDQYDYELPRELIAQHPLQRRSDARLLLVRRAENSLDHMHVRDLPDVLHEGDCLVLNDTRVVPARLTGRRTRTDGRWGGLFLSADESGVWKILSKTRGKLSNGETITLVDREGRDSTRLVLLTKLEGGAWAARPETENNQSAETGQQQSTPTTGLSAETDRQQSPFEILDKVGHVPLPPYIRDGRMVDSDRRNYQTIYAEKPGAVAAPTAGLHFTEELLRRIKRKNVEICRVTLHVGLGTFRPISAERLDDHEMHTEWGCIEDATVENLKNAKADGGRVVSVGTTSARVLETAAANGNLQAWQGETNLFIKPPYTFKAIDGLMTNFHLPKSTLLILVRALGGDDLVRRAYEEAIREEYRFYSYGDAMLIV